MCKEGIESVLPSQLIIGFTAAVEGLEHLYLQPCHPGYLLNKLPMQAFVYMQVCVTLKSSNMHMCWSSTLDRQYMTPENINKDQSIFFRLS